MEALEAPPRAGRGARGGEGSYGRRRFISMRRSSCHHAKVDHARRLAELTIQPNVEEVLLCIAEEFDRLADDFATGEVDFHHPEIPEHS
jgi:hypothetical protein